MSRLLSSRDLLIPEIAHPLMHGRIEGSPRHLKQALMDNMTFRETARRRLWEAEPHRLHVTQHTHGISARRSQLQTASFLEAYISS